MKEANLMRRLMLAIGQRATVWRNNIGTARYPDGATVRYGVAHPGGSDLIGLRSVTVTPDMVGQRLAQFVAIEVKTPDGRLTPDQERFLAFVRDAGGIALIARSEADLSALDG